jgi:sugar lactone lactonase YvrE
MPKRDAATIVAAFGLAVWALSAMTACSPSPAPTRLPTTAPTLAPTTTKAPTVTKVPTKTLTPTPTRIPTRTPTATPESLPPNAASRCEAAFAAPVSGGAPAGPILTMLSRQYGDKKWDRNRLAHIEPLTMSGAQTLVCIRENRKRVGAYGAFSQSPGGAYKYDWDVRLVRLSDGRVIASKALVGGDPPRLAALEGHGTRPQGSLIGWLMPLLGETSQQILPQAFEVCCLDYSADGKTLAAGGREIATLWNVTTGKVVHTLDAHTDEVYAVAFTPDGKTLATGGRDLDKIGFFSAVKLWDVASGKLLRTLKGQGDQSRGIAFSPDGKLLITSSSWRYDKALKLWNVATGKELRAFTHTNNPTSIVFSPDGRTIVSADGSEVKIWDVETGRVTRAFTGGWSMDKIIGFSPDRRLLVSGAGKGTIKLWDMETGEVVRVLDGHTHWATSVAFSPDGKTMASASEDTTVILWNVTTGEAIRTLVGHADDVTAVAFSLDGKMLASASADMTVRLWDLTTGQ